MEHQRMFILYLLHISY